jgi:hypothetical protein
MRIFRDEPGCKPPSLDWFALRVGLVIPLLFAVVFWRVTWTAAIPPLRNALLVRDALNLWAGGTLARTGGIATIFDPSAYWHATQAMFGHRFAMHTWSYPPAMLLLAVPVSLLPMVAAFLAWNVMGTALLWLGARMAGLGRVASLIALVSPAALESLLAGQNGALCAALLLPGLVLMDRQPWVAGMLLGALILKPQLAALLPVCLLASRNWRAVTAAALSASALVGLSALAFGLGSWIAFVRQVLPFMRHEILEAPWFNGPYQPMIATPFMAVRWAGASLAAAYLLQAISTTGAAALCWRAWRDPGADPLGRAALTLALTFLATPYGYSYDMPALAAALIGLAVRDGPWRGKDRALFAIAWIWPGWGFWLGTMGMPPLGLAAVASAALLAWRAQQRQVVPDVPGISRVTQDRGPYNFGGVKRNSL